MAENNRKVLVTFRVTGTFTASVPEGTDADVSRMLESASRTFEETDFGELRNIDGRVVTIEPEEGSAGIDFTDPVARKAYELAGVREKYAMLAGTQETVFVNSKECRRFILPEDSEFQDANGATYDILGKRWIG
jgi:hypothetical protein